jgi:hypothetical protein
LADFNLVLRRPLMTILIEFAHFQHRCFCATVCGALESTKERNHRTNFSDYFKTHKQRTFTLLLLIEKRFKGTLFLTNVRVIGAAQFIVPMRCFRIQ